MVALRKARKRARLTQADLAKRVGVSQAAISKWERDSHAAPTFQQHAAIAKEVGIDPSELRYGRAVAHS